jgi:RHS repeat-associated protein
MTVKGTNLYHNDRIGLAIRNGSTTIDAFTRTPDGQPIDQRMKNKSDGAINRYYYLLDGLGSIVALTDSTGGTAMPLPATYKYDPYGNDAGTTGSVTSRFRFAGGYLSTSLGLYKFGERWYDPTTGRWQQQDLLDDPLAQKGWNRYDYAADDPVDFVDPSGALSLPCSSLSKGFKCATKAYKGYEYAKACAEGGVRYRSVGGCALGLAKEHVKGKVIDTIVRYTKPECAPILQNPVLKCKDQKKPKMWLM